MAKTTADLLIDRLMTGGVPTIFGFLGHGINSVFEAVRTRQAQLRCMQVWHEAAAAFATPSYACTTGRLVGCLVTANPEGYPHARRCGGR